MVNWMTSGLFVLIWCGIQSISQQDWNNHRAPLSVCDLIVDAGPDTNVCAPGGSVQLQGSITGNDIFYQWSPASGLSNPFILNPTANITDEITYTLIAFGVDPDAPNLVVNGDFSGGNSGFNSDYNYVVDIPGQQNEMVPEGTYTVIHNPNLVHSGFSACSDHTGGNGNMMVINGAANFQDIWCQTVTVDPGQLYNVSAWVASVNPSSPAELQFSINGTPIGPIVNAVATPCEWTPFNAIWNSGGNSTAEICILNLNTALGGNDFALDDISMTALCSVEDEVTITIYEEEAPEPDIDGPTFLCEGETAAYTASFPPDPEIFSYTWTVTPGATIVSGQGTPTVTVLWEETQDAQLCLAIETRCEENEACFEVSVGTLPEFPLITGPTALCPGETVTFYTPEFDPGDSYNWIVPAELNIISGEGTNEIDVEWAMEGEVEICVQVTNACGTTDNCTVINLYPSFLTLFDTTICEGSTIDINGTIYGNGIWTGIETFTSIHGCDSIVEVDITEANVLEFFQDIQLCPGDSIFLNGAYQTQEGIYTEDYITTEGCDSIVITTVSITPFDTTLILLSSCNPTDTGTIVVHYVMGNCDSTVITTTQLLPSDTTVITRYSCAPADTGSVSALYSNQYGCDSIVHTITLLNPTDTTLLSFTSCDPSNVGVTEQHLTNQYGCDSLVISTTTYLQSDTTLIFMPTCLYADTGTVSLLLTNTEGCDSLVMTTTTYAGSDTTFLSDASCEAIDSGWHFLPLLNIYGCDSIVALYTAWLSADTTYLASSSCSIQDTGTFIQSLFNQNGCDSTVITSISLLPVEQCSLEVTLLTEQPRCAGETAEITLSISIGLAPASVQWINLENGEQGNANVLIIPTTSIIQLTTPGTYVFTVTAASGLTWMDTVEMIQVPDLIVELEAPTDVYGHQLQCHGDSTGMIYTNILSPGTPPYIFTWSNGEVQDTLSSLPQGSYSLTVTDNNGCIVDGSIVLNAPDPISYSIDLDHVRCFGRSDGAIFLNNLSGGITPLLTSLNMGIAGETTVYPGLPAGPYHLEITDQNGCQRTEDLVIEQPEAWSVQLGPDTIVALGTSIELIGQLNGQPVEPFEISWSDGLCDGCLSRSITPSGQESFEITIVDQNGCVQQDEIVVGVYVNRDFYVPNVFSPNGDLINDYFLVSAGPGVEVVEAMTIYDRWGEIVFAKRQFLPNDVHEAWDGSVRGKTVNPGVFAYIMTVRFKDGRIETKYGDVTIVR
jgi:gliding motility-associated-like protein